MIMSTKAMIVKAQYRNGQGNLSEVKAVPIAPRMNAKQLCESCSQQFGTNLNTVQVLPDGERDDPEKSDPIPYLPFSDNDSIED